jgi:hypothetical protein
MGWLLNCPVHEYEQLLDHGYSALGFLPLKRSMSKHYSRLGMFVIPS